VAVVLAVDGGNTKTIAVVASGAGEVLGVGRGGGSDIYGFGSPGVGLGVIERAARDALASAAVDPASIAASAFSLAGADWPEDMALIQAEMGARLGLLDPLVVNDAIGGLRCGTADWVGIAIVCGTFNAVGARNVHGATFHCGFWPDRTGAYDLSVAALKAVYREGLQLGPATELTSRALAMYGAHDPLHLLHHFTRRDHPDRGEVVRMAPVLLDVAGEGDEVALAIVDDAGRVLGDEGRVCAERVSLPLDGTPVVLSGGVFNHPSTLLASAVMRQLPRAVAVRPEAPPIAGVVLLALDRIGAAADVKAIARQIG
jgi:N-acetylglucosamine kinase-like BadF-type ATPase